MDVAITGVHGLIGTALGSSGSTRATGHRTVLAWSATMPVAGPRRRAVGSGGRARSTPPRLEGVDAVVHLAGAGIGDKRWTPSASAASSTAACRAPTCSRARSPGSSARRRCSCRARRSGYYGSRGDEPLTEDSRPGRRLHRRRVRAVGGGDQPAGRCAGIRVVTHPYRDRARGARGRARAACCSRSGSASAAAIGSGRQYMSWIALDDEVGAIIARAHARRARRAVNVTAPNPVTNAEFMKTLGRGAAPTDGAAHAAAAAEGRLRRRARRSTCWSRDSASSGQARGDAIPVPAPRTRGRAAGGAGDAGALNVRFWIDTDVGTDPDDAFALLAAAGHPASSSSA